MLSEKRKNPEVNPKISIYDNLKPYYDLDVKNDESKYFIHLTGDVSNYKLRSKMLDISNFVDIPYVPSLGLHRKNIYLPKFGINPEQNYETTPFGIYAYSLKDSWTMYNIGTYENLSGLNFPIRKKDREYVYILKAKNPKKIINIETYTEEQLERDKKLLNKFYDYDFSKEFEDSFTGFHSEEHTNLPYFKLMNITYNIAKKYSKNKTIIMWNSIFRKLGYDGIYDPGLGLIHPDQPSQCVFFYRNAVDIVDLFYNKTYEKIEKKVLSTNQRLFTIKNREFIGYMKNGILHFDYLTIIGLNLKSLKKLPWAKHPYVVQNTFDCHDNLLENLEGGPIYAKEYNCSNNLLNSLKGSPNEVWTFDCSNNKNLKSLMYSPKKCYHFICKNSIIESLQYLPEDLEVLNCSNNELTSLKYLPKSITNLTCSNNKLIDLRYSSDKMFYLNCSNNPTLISLEGSPKECYEFICNNCGLDSLKGISQKISLLRFENNDIKSLKGLEECKEIYGKGNINLKYDFKPKNLEVIKGFTDYKRIYNFLNNNLLEQ